MAMSDETSREIHFAGADDKPAPWTKAGAVICALLVTSTLLGGFFLLHRRHQQQAAAAQQAASVMKKNAVVEAQIYEDEAQLKGGNALISGLVRNISNARIDDLSVEIQLIPRAGENFKLAQINLQPATLNPGEEGRYSLSVPSHQWSATRLVRLLSAARTTEIAFRSQVGERRPLESPPQGVKVIVVPRTRDKGDGFLNTPDNPIPIK